MAALNERALRRVRRSDQVGLFVVHGVAYLVVNTTLQLALGGASWLWWGIGVAAHTAYVLVGGGWFVDWQAARARRNLHAPDAR